MSTSHLPLPIPPLSTLRAALAAFTASTSPFRILHTTSTSTSTSSPPPSPPLPPKPLYILDSSFNPPTTAHLTLATSALRSSPSPSTPPAAPAHLLLLLATRNADKSPSTTPAPLEHRLAMMALLATEIVAHAHPAGGDQGEEGVRVDVGVTREAYFHAKAGAIAGSGVYAPTAAAEGQAGKQPQQLLEQVFLVGFDTLVRLLDPRYYAPAHTLAPLGPFFEQARVRVTRRGSGEWGGREAQDGYLERFEWEEKGGRREWRPRVELVDAAGVEEVSSSKVRAMVRSGEAGWEGLVGEGVRRWVSEEGLYKG